MQKDIANWRQCDDSAFGAQSFGFSSSHDPQLGLLQRNPLHLRNYGGMEEDDATETSPAHATNRYQPSPHQFEARTISEVEDVGRSGDQMEPALGLSGPGVAMYDVSPSIDDDGGGFLGQELDESERDCIIPDLLPLDSSLSPSAFDFFLPADEDIDRADIFSTWL